MDLSQLSNFRVSGIVKHTVKKAETYSILRLLSNPRLEIRHHNFCICFSEESNKHHTWTINMVWRLKSRIISFMSLSALLHFSPPLNDSVFDLAHYFLGDDESPRGLGCLNCNKSFRPQLVEIGMQGCSCAVYIAGYHSVRSCVEHI